MMRCGYCGNEVDVEHGFKTCAGCKATYQKRATFIGNLINLVGLVFFIPGSLMLIFHPAPAVILMIIGIGIFLIVNQFFFCYRWEKEKVKVIIDRSSWR